MNQPKIIFKFEISRPTFSLLLLTALSGFLLFVRMYETHQTTGVFLIWNLFLAWIPLFFALVGRRFSFPNRKINFQEKYFIGTNLLLWLLFFPNSTYIITDLMHLSHLDKRLLWFDSVGIFIAALNGLAVGLYSLYVVHEILERLFSRLFSWILIVFSIGLSGFGIFLGRFVRLNSWDLFTNPFELAMTCLRQLQNPLAIKTTIIFGFVTMVLYLAFVILLPSTSNEELKKNHYEFQ